MRITLWDVSWTGERHNERTVATCLDLVNFAADRGYTLVKAPAGDGTWNLYRDGGLRAVAEIKKDSDSAGAIYNPFDPANPRRTPENRIETWYDEPEDTEPEDTDVYEVYGGEA